MAAPPFSFVSLEEYVALLQTDPKLTRANLALTFDDGYARTYALAAPVLREEGIPTTFFANTVNRDKGLLWFVYFNALCSEKAYPAVEINGVSHPLDTKRNSLRAWKALIQLARSSPDARAFADEFASKYPLPAQIQDKYAGLRSEQLAEIGASTIFSSAGTPTATPIWTNWGRQSSAMKCC